MGRKVRPDDDEAIVEEIPLSENQVGVVEEVAHVAHDDLDDLGRRPLPTKNYSVEEAHTNKWVLLPDNPFVGRWDATMSLMLLFTSTVTPFEVPLKITLRRYLA